jgi:hypothetical protein
MSHQRRTQWTHRLEYLLALRERFRAAHQYDRAYETYLTIQHAYDTGRMRCSVRANSLFVAFGSSKTRTTATCRSRSMQHLK